MSGVGVINVECHTKWKNMFSADVYFYRCKICCFSQISNTRKQCKSGETGKENAKPSTVKSPAT